MQFPIRECWLTSHPLYQLLSTELTLSLHSLSKFYLIKKNLKGNVKFQFISQRKAEETLFLIIFINTSYFCLSYDCKSLFSPICLQDTKMCICSALCPFIRGLKQLDETSFILKVSQTKEET